MKRDELVNELMTLLLTFNNLNLTPVGQADAIVAFLETKVDLNKALEERN